MEGSLPSPNFTGSNEGQNKDFLGFSSTPIPGENFKPKWGKKNRSQNWNRFGSFNEGEEAHQGNHNNHRGNQNNQGQFQNSPNQRGQYHSSPQMRGSPSQFTPRGRGNFHNGGRGGGYQNSPIGGRGGGYQNTPNGNQGGYFNPAMLRNPWADLEWAREHKNQGNLGGDEEPLEENRGDEETVEENRGDEESQPNDVMSDSMIPQVGESLLERNNDITNVDDDLEEINDSVINDTAEGDSAENI